MNAKSKFWLALQRLFGFEPRTHYFDVPESIRNASHDSTNEVMMLRSELRTHRDRDSVLRDLVQRMQQTLAERDNEDSNNAHHH
jgi:hypothetical protein